MRSGWRRRSSRPASEGRRESLCTSCRPSFRSCTVRAGAARTSASPTTRSSSWRASTCTRRWRERIRAPPSRPSRALFPSPSDAGSRLVMKVLNLEGHPDVARWLRSAVAAVDGVLIDADLEHGELIDLFTCADAYVSLHRSEGFGFGMAEAMALGKPVIATAYSGNLDFQTAANCCPVSYHVREITGDDHVYNEGIADVYERGAMRADPDIDQAARWMPAARRRSCPAPEDRRSRPGHRPQSLQRRGCRRRSRAPPERHRSPRGSRRRRPVRTGVTW